MPAGETVTLPDGINTIPIQGAVYPFKDLYDIEINAQGTPVPKLKTDINALASQSQIEATAVASLDGVSPGTKILITVIGPNIFSFGEKSPVRVDFNQSNFAEVTLPLPGATMRGMMHIIEPESKATQDYFRQVFSGGDPNAVVKFVGGNSEEPLTGHSLMWDVGDKRVMMPWLNGEDFIAGMAVASPGSIAGVSIPKEYEGKPYVLFNDPNGKLQYYLGEDGNKQPFIDYLTGVENSGNTFRVPLEKLLIEIEASEKVTINKDGRYMIGDESISRYLKDKGYDQQIVELYRIVYEHFFTPEITPEAWEISEEDKDKTLAEMMFPIVTGVNGRNRYAINLKKGTLNLAVLREINGDNDLKDRPPDELQWIREDLVADLNENPDLGRVLSVIRSSIDTIISEAVQEDEKNAASYQGYGNFTVVIEQEIVEDENTKQIVTRQRATQMVIKVWDEKSKQWNFTYYSVDAMGIITLLTKEEESQLMPRLAFNSEGEMVRIDLPDDHPDKKVSLEGFVTISPIDAYEQHPIEKTIRNIRLAKRLGATVIRLNIVPELAISKIDTTKQIIAEAERNGMYVILSPAAKSSAQGTFNDLPNGMPDEEVIKDVIKLAELMSPYNNVILDTWTEIGVFGREQELFSILSGMIERIRKVNDHAIIAVPAVEWSSNATYYINHPFEDPLVLYGINDDPWTPPNTGLDQDRRYLWTGLITQKRPVLIRESGYVFQDDMQTRKDASWIEGSLKIVEERPYQVHFTGFLFAGEGWFNDIIAKPGDPGAKQLLPEIAPDLEDIFFTPRGYPIALKLVQRPPKQFDK